MLDPGGMCGQRGEQQEHRIALSSLGEGNEISGAVSKTVRKLLRADIS